MNLDTYRKKKAAGLLRLIAVGGGYAIAMQKFDAETGQPVAPDVQAIDLTQLQQERERVAGLLAEIDALLADLKELQ